MLREDVVPWGAIKTGIKPSEIQPNKQITGTISQGGVDSFEFVDISQIEKGVWHSDFPLSAIWMFGLNRTFKTEDFYNVPQQGVLMAWHAGNSPSETILKHRSERFARIASWCQEHHPDVKMTDISYLSEAFTEKSNSIDDPMSPFWQQAYTGRVDYEWPIPANAPETREITLMLHPWTFAQSIISKRVPKGQWRQVSEWMSSTKDRLIWLKQQENPVLLKVMVNNENKPDNQRYMNTILGIRGKAFLYAERKAVFMTGEELLWLSNYTMDFEIENAWIGEGWHYMEKSEELIEGDDQLAPYSTSRALLALNKVIGLMTPPISKRHTLYPTAEMVWLRAYDRLATATTAIEMVRKGWFILSHGNGWFKIAIAGEQLKDPERNNFLLENKLMLPPNWITQQDMKVIATMNHVDEYYMDLILKFINPMAFNYIDRISLPWAGKRKEVVERMQLSAVELTNIYTKHTNSTVVADFKRKLLTQAKASVNRMKGS